MFVTWIVILGNNINLPNSHPSVLGHCYLFLVKNRVFGLLDWIAPKLPQKIRKNSRIMTPIEGTSYGMTGTTSLNAEVAESFWHSNFDFHRYGK